MQSDFIGHRVIVENEINDLHSHHSPLTTPSINYPSINKHNFIQQFTRHTVCFLRYLSIIHSQQSSPKLSDFRALNSSLTVIRRLPDVICKRRLPIPLRYSRMLYGQRLSSSGISNQIDPPLCPLSCAERSKVLIPSCQRFFVSFSLRHTIGWIPLSEGRSSRTDQDRESTASPRLSQGQNREGNSQFPWPRLSRYARLGMSWTSSRILLTLFFI